MSARPKWWTFLRGGDPGFRGVATTNVVAIIINLACSVIDIGTGARVGLLVVTILALSLSLVLMHRLRRHPPALRPTARQQPPAYKGLIVLISKGRSDRPPMDQSAGDAIEYHAGVTGPEKALEHCWLIATPGVDGSQPYAERIAEECGEMGIKAHVEVVADGFDVQGTYDLVRRIYAEAEEATGLAPKDIISDFTGGVKPMSVGMALACAKRYPMQYMYGGKPDIASLPRRVVFESAE